MKKLSSLAFAVLVGSAAFVAVPAIAAPASPDNVPYCASTTAPRELKDGVFDGQLKLDGLNPDSVDLWNGCLKAVYTDSSGHATTAFYDPDSLKLIETMDSAGTKIG